MKRIAILMLATSLMLAQETPQEKELRSLRAEVRALRKQAETQAKIIRELRAEIARLRKQSPTSRPAKSQPAKIALPPVKILKQFKEPLSIGQIAEIKTIKVVQVQDKHNVLAEIVLAGRGRPYSVRNPLTGMIMRGNHPKTTLVWIAGIETDGMVDGISAKIDRVLKIVRTKRYQTTLGAMKTVFLLEPIK